VSKRSSISATAELSCHLWRVCRRRDEASFCAIIDGDGEVTDFLRLPHVMKRRGGWNRDDAELKVTNLSDWLSHSVGKRLDFVSVLRATI